MAAASLAPLQLCICFVIFQCLLTQCVFFTFLHVYRLLALFCICICVSYYICCIVGGARVIRFSLPFLHCSLCAYDIKTSTHTVTQPQSHTVHAEHTTHKLYQTTSFINVPRVISFIYLPIIFQMIVIKCCTQVCVWCAVCDGGALCWIRTLWQWGPASVTGWSAVTTPRRLWSVWGWWRW